MNKLPILGCAYAYGQGVKSFGADWYVLEPNGSKLDTGDESHGSSGNAS